MTSTPPAGTSELAAALSQRDDDGLAALLAARPDLAAPAPSSLTSLAARAGSRPSIERALRRLNAAELAVLQHLALTDDPAASDPRPVAESVAMTTDSATAAAGRGPKARAHEPEARADGPADELPDTDPARVLARLEQLALTVDGVPVAGLAEAVAALPSLEEPAEAASPAPTDPSRSPRAVPGAVAQAEGARQAEEIVRLVAALLELWQDGAGILRTGGIGVRELRRVASELGLSERQATFVVELTAMAELLGHDDGERPAWVPARTASDWLADPLPERWARLAAAWSTSARTPWLVGTRRDGALRAALEPTLERGWAVTLRHRVLAALARLPEDSGSEPAGVRALLAWDRPLATAPEDVVAAVLEEAAALGLVAGGALTDLGRAILAPLPGPPSAPPSPAGPSAPRGRSSPRTAGDAAPSPEGDTPAPAADRGEPATASGNRSPATDGGDPRPTAKGDPRTTTDVPPAPDRDPRATTNEERIALPDRPLAESPERERALAEALEATLPEPVEDLLVQGDLTGVVPGRPAPALAALLERCTEVESRGSGLTVRFTPGSVRRALDAGADADALLERLARHSRAPLPQALEYLVRDTARRHGQIRVGAASAFLLVEDESLAAQLTADPSLRRLELRALAPTVLVSSSAPGVVLRVLREAGLAPVAEGSDAPGAMTVAARRRPAVAPSSPGAARSTYVRFPDPGELARLAARMRAGEEQVRRDVARHSADGPVATDPVHALELLRASAAAGEEVEIELVGGFGGTERRRARPLSVDGGRVRVADLDRDTELTVAIHRIISVEAR